MSGLFQSLFDIFLLLSTMKLQLFCAGGMNMKKKQSTLLVMLLIFGLLIGCGTQGSIESAVSEEASIQSVEEPGVMPEEPESEEEPEISVEATEQATAVSFPLEETMNVTMWCGVPPFMSDYLNDSTDMSIYREMEQLTNVHMDIEFVNGIVESEQFSLMAAADAWTDIVCKGASMYGAGAYTDEIFIDLSDVIREYSPYLQSYLDNDRELLLNVLNDDGQILSFPKINYENKTSEIWGMAYRGDYLDALNLETPTTIAEFEETMTAVKNEFGSQVFCGNSGLLNFLYYAYDIELGIGDNAAPLTVVDDQIRFGYYEDAAFDYFTTMHSWLESGLLYSDYLAVDTSLNFEEGLVLDGSASTGVVSLSILSSYNKDLAEGEYLTGGASIKENAEDTLYAGYVKSEAYNDAIWSISTLCDEEKIPVIAAYADYFYTDAGYMLVNWGVEGEAFDYDENGNPYYTDLVMNNPQGMGYTVAQYLYATVTGTSVPMIFDVDRDDASYTEAELQVKEVWASCFDTSHKIPTSLQLNTEESEAFQEVWGDLNTYLAESALTFLTDGITREQFDEFRSNLESAGVQTVIDLYQAAYDRYNRKADNY